MIVALVSASILISVCYSKFKTADVPRDRIVQFPLSTPRIVNPPNDDPSPILILYPPVEMRRILSLDVAAELCSKLIFVVDSVVTLN